SAFDEVARVGVELPVAEDDRHAHLVAARELDVDAVGVLRARREAGIEGRLVPAEVDAGCRLGGVPLGLGRIEGGARRRGEQRDAHQEPGRPHLSFSSSDTMSVPFPTGPSSAARAVTFLSESLPTNGRLWKSQSLPSTKPNSTSHGRGAPVGSRAGSSFSFSTRPAPTSSVISAGSRTWSRPVAA